MTNQKSRDVLDRLAKAGRDLAPMLGGRKKPGDLAPQLGGDRAIPTLQEVLTEAGVKIELPIPVAGVTFERRQEIISRMDGTEPIHIVAEPDNEYDPNALAVIVRMDDGPQKIGYVPRHIASTLAPILAGRSVRISVARMVGRGFMARYNEINQGVRIE